jgi:hypothetical protein
MHRKPYTLLGVVGLLLLLVALMPVSTFGAAGSAAVGVVEGAGKTFHVRDWDGKEVEVTLPSQSAQDIRTDNETSKSMGGPATGQSSRTVRATVVSVDAPSRSARVRTQYGQTIVLTTLTEDIQPGEEIILMVPR